MTAPPEPFPSAGDLLLGGGLLVAALVYLTLTLVEGARLVLGSLAAQRISTELGLRPLDPGSRAWMALELVRALAMAALIGGSAAGPRPWCGVWAAVLCAGTTVVGAGVLKALGAPLDPERIIRAAGPLLKLIDGGVGPLLAPLARVHEGLSQRARHALAEGDDDAREEQLEEVIKGAEQEGLLEEEESAIIRDVVEAGDLIVRDVMTKRAAIDSVPADATVVEVAHAFIRSRHSRLLVYEGNLDRVVGVLAVRDVLPHLAAPGETAAPLPPALTARDLMRPVPHVPSAKGVLELLRELRLERQQMAVVVDEYGGTAGLVSLEDLIEEVVGDIRDEHEVPIQELRPDGHGGYLADGLLPVEELSRLVGEEIDSEGVETLGGMVFARLGRVPRVGERVKIDHGVALEVVRMLGRRIALLRVTLEAVEKTQERT